MSTRCLKFMSLIAQVLSQRLDGETKIIHAMSKPARHMSSSYSGQLKLQGVGDGHVVRVTSERRVCVKKSLLLTSTELRDTCASVEACDVSVRIVPRRVQIYTCGIQIQTHGNDSAKD